MKAGEWLLPPTWIRFAGVLAGASVAVMASQADGVAQRGESPLGQIIQYVIAGVLIVLGLGFGEIVRRLRPKKGLAGTELTTTEVRAFYQEQRDGHASRAAYEKTSLQAIGTIVDTQERITKTLNLMEDRMIDREGMADLTFELLMAVAEGRKVDVEVWKNWRDSSSRMRQKQRTTGIQE